jgi:hypothetical protein
MGWSSLLLDGDTGEYVKEGCTSPAFEDGSTELGDSVDGVAKGDCVGSPGTVVIFAGPSSTGLEEAGGMLVELAGAVGATIVSALLKAIGGSHEPRKSRPHDAQAGSIPRI